MQDENIHACCEAGSAVFPVTLLRLPGALFRLSFPMHLLSSLRARLRRFTPEREAFAGSCIEPLEARIAPATLLGPYRVTFEGKNGDAVTVQISKPLFTAANVGHVFTFDTGSVNGSNSTPQQLETLDITQLGAAAAGMNISITAQAGSSPGTVNVGYINASDIDLGAVSVAGDLGRIAAGDLNFSTHGLASLTVASMGAAGITTQAAGGNLNTLLAGGVGSITINGNLDDASIGIGGGALGTLGSLLVKGNIIGGAADYSGSVRTQGTISNVEVDGSILGGAGNSSGTIGTSASLGTVLVEGSVTGAGGQFSGALLATGSIGSVQINGNLSGGSGGNSGQIGTASTLGKVTIEGSVTGGGGPLSGTVLATGNITSVTIDGTLNGGSGAGAGQIGSAASIGPVIVYGGILNGALIHAHQNIQSVSVPGALPNHIADGAGIQNSSITTDIGWIGSITAYAVDNTAMSGVTISAGSYVGPITASAGQPFGPNAGYGIYETNVTAAAIGNITAHAGSGQTAIDASNFTATGAIGIVDGAGGNLSAGGITDSTFIAGAGIAGITASTSGLLLGPALGLQFNAILNSGFDAGGSIGAISSAGGIAGSIFVAGIDLGSKFSVSGAGAFNNAAAAAMGFGSSSSSLAAQIGSINVSNATDLNGSPSGGIQQSTFLAGVHGAGADGTFGTRDDSVGVGSSIGTITATAGLDSVFIESGDIGATNVGSIASTKYIATDTSVTGQGIGAITVGSGGGSISTLAVHAQGDAEVSPPAGVAIGSSSFTSNSNIGNLSVTLAGARVAGANGGIVSSTFQAGHALGSITVVDSASGAAGTNYGIDSSTFNGGLDGYGATGDINVSLTATGSNGNSAGILDSKFDADVCACMSANMGSISVSNADSAPSAAGIWNSTFRVHGNMGTISAIMNSGVPTATAIKGSTFSAYGSIANIYAYGSIVGDAHGPSRFLAGYDIGSDMTFGNEDLSTGSLALQSGQSIGNVTATGYFSGSDIAASVNPGAAYVFGDTVTGVSANNNTDVGTGGSIGIISIGMDVPFEGTPFVSDHATQHAIEAASFASATVSAFGFTSPLPAVLYVDGGSGDVRITEV